ncbi:hypothetical protein AB4Z27_26010 [Cupriavidus sp. KB_39]|uniref:hypothetical protein n=1 Tax=Cupriavidus sp. KB_39 TaxID=3233036 RepID=UPI003F8F7DAF
MIEQHAVRVAHARDQLSEAIRAAGIITARRADIQQHIAAACARRDAALLGLRSGDLQENVGAARLAIAKADIDDLEQLAAGIQPEIAAVEQARRAAEDAVRAAETSLAHAERALVIQGLDKVVIQLEAKLCAAISERHRLAVEQSGGGFLMLSRTWSPSKPLFDAITAGVPPMLPAR